MNGWILLFMVFASGWLGYQLRKTMEKKSIICSGCKEKVGWCSCGQGDWVIPQHIQER